MNWKRILLVIGFVALVILFAVILYFLFFAPRPKPSIPPSQVVPPIGLPTIPGQDRVQPTPAVPARPPSEVTIPENVIPIGTELPATAVESQGGPVRMALVQTNKNLNTALAPDGKTLVTFDALSGLVYRISPNGKSEKITDKTFAGAYNVEWSGQADKAIFQFPDNSNIVYDFNRSKTYVLPKHWDKMRFSPDGNQLIFKSLGDDPENQWLAISNIDGTGARGVENMGVKAGLFTASWSPSDQIVGSFRDGVSYDRQKIYFIGKNKESFDSTTIDGRGFEYIWSPLGDKIMYSVYSSASEYMPELWMMDAIGNSIGTNKRRITIQTWAHKCTFTDNDNAYCAVPKELIIGAGLMPSYGDAGEDVIYKLDLTTGTKTKIAEPPERHTISKVTASRDESVLYFTDKDTGQIFKIDLK